jgi:predicted O-methyltransferase YrrM
MLEIVGYNDIPLLSRGGYNLHWTDEEDTNIICSLLKDRNNILEIGTYLGHTCENIRRTTFAEHITTVDITKELLCSKNLQYQDHEVLDFNLSGSEILEDGRVTQIKKFSDVFFLENSKQFDGILIDGDHSYEQVKKDTENALACLKKGGVIIWHDVYNKDGENDRKCLAEPHHNDTREYLESEFPFTAQKIGRSWVAHYVS